MVTDLEGLRQTLRMTQFRIGKIETAARVQSARKLIGKTFRYRNCYSCPEKPSDYWFLYIKVIGVDRYGSLRVLQFQTDKNGDIRIESNHFLHRLLEGYEEIPRGTFDRALMDLKKKIAKGINQ